ncbi:MAG: hypothetical protein QM765_31785 [Myxococcales bacterium]
MKRLALMLCALSVVSGCRLTLDPDASGPDAKILDVADASSPDVGTPAHPGTLTVRGQVCTKPVVERVKILFLMDASGSMCVTDGPSASPNAGICEQIATYLKGEGVTVPGRVRALKTLMEHLALQDGVSVALVPFDTSIALAYPSDGFVPATDPQLTMHIDALPAALGKGTDYQGALDEAFRRISKDIADTAASADAASLPHTRYITIILSDGFPYPRCSSNDTLTSWATAANPEGTWPDNPATFCNTPPAVPDAGNPECLGTDCPAIYSDLIPTYRIGDDRNQNGALFSRAAALAALAGGPTNVPEVRLDTVMLFNTAALAACGSICYESLYSYPGGTPDDGRKVARWTLEQLAMRGGGAFHEYIDPNELSFAWLGTSDLGRPAQAVPRTPFVHRYAGAMTPEVSPGFPGAERPIRPDTDGDGFPDDFEAAHAADGFDPAIPTPGGCKSVNGAGIDFPCDDADGDGLSKPMEVVLGTDPFAADTDGDGLPDGLEVDLGLDPRVSNAGLDKDGDQVGDLDEVLRGSNPAVSDASSATTHAAPKVTAVPQADGTTCYDFVVADIWLSPAGFSGRNYLTVPFAQIPSNAASNQATWRQACLFAEAKPDSALEVVLSDADFWPMARFGAEPGQVLPRDYATLCKDVR